MFRSVKPRKARLPVHSTVAKTEVEEKKVESSMVLQDIFYAFCLGTISIYM